MSSGAVIHRSHGGNVTDLRNQLIHGYDTINFDILWTIIQDDLPPLIEQLEAIIGEKT